MTVDELNAVDASKTDYLLGLVGEGHVAFVDQSTDGVDPSLEQMVGKAIEVKKKRAARPQKASD